MNNFSNCDWENLPDHILVHIFSFLPHKDRFNASLICRSWEENFHDVSLWEKFKFTFRNQGSDARAVQYVKRFGSILKSVEIINASWINANSYSEDLYKCLVRLVFIQDPKLDTLVLRGCIYDGNNEECYSLTLVSNLLVEQKNLRSLSLEDSIMEKTLGFQLLESAVCNSRDSLERLNVKRLFYHPLDEEEMRSFFKIITSLKNLRYLSLDDCCINENILATLDRKEWPNFQLLKISCRTGLLEHFVREDWEHMKRVFRKIEVEFKIGYYFQLTEVYRKLPENLPLIKLNLGYFEDQSEYPNLLAYLGDHFQNTLKTLILSFVKGNPDLINPIISCLKRLHRVHDFKIATTPKMTEELFDQLLLENVPSLKSVSLQLLFFKDDGIGNVVEYQEDTDNIVPAVQNKYGPLFAEKGVHFILKQNGLIHFD